MNKRIRELLTIVDEGQDSEQSREIERYIIDLETTLDKIKNIIGNEKVSGIEAKLMIKDILEERKKNG